MSQATSFANLYARLGLETGSYLVHYNFDVSGAIQNVASGQPTYTGLLNTNNNTYYQNSGVGTHTGNYVEISGAATGLNYISDWTIFLSFEQSVTGSGILYSTYSTGLVNGTARDLGFALGMGSGNKLNFFYTDNDPTGQFIDQLLPSKNIVAASKFDNNVYLHWYNFETNRLKSKYISIENPCTYLSGNRMVLGSAPFAPSNFAYRNFNGYIDEFAFISGSLSPTDIKYLMQAFFSEITGTTGIIITPPPTTGDPPPTPVTFGMSGIQYIRAIDSGDFTEVYTQTSTNFPGRHNKIASWDASANKFALNSYYGTNTTNIYLNGDASIEGIGVFIGDNCSGQLQLSDGYLIEDYHLQTTGYFDQFDNVIYDIIDGTSRVYSGFHHLAGTGNSPIRGSGEFWFLNGAKLTSGTQAQTTGNFTDYWQSGEYINFSTNNSLFDNATGILHSEPYLSNISGYTGRFSGIALPKFTKGSSQVWLNGVRQIINLDYVEF